MTGRQRRRRRQLLSDLKEMRNYCKLIDEALDRTVWTTGLEEAVACREKDYGIH